MILAREQNISTLRTYSQSSQFDGTLRFGAVNAQIAYGLPNSGFVRLNSARRWRILRHLFSRQPHLLRDVVGALLHRQFGAVRVLSDFPDAI